MKSAEGDKTRNFVSEIKLALISKFEIFCVHSHDDF